MKKLKIFGIFVFLLWLIALVTTFSNSLYWYVCFIISGAALILASLLLYQPNLSKSFVYKRANNSRLKDNPKKQISYDDYDEDYDILDNRRKRKKRKRKRRPTSYLETSMRELKKTNEHLGSSNEIHRTTSIRNKEYLHTKIKHLYNSEKQKVLFETIQRLKESDFFTSYYAGVTNEDLIMNIDEYEERNIFELYDNVIPNTYAKVLYEPISGMNRIGIFLGSTNDSTEEVSLGFIDIDDSEKADLLLNKYDNIQVFSTILGGTYKRAYRNKDGEVKIIKDFINYDLTISLAFYNY